MRKGTVCICTLGCAKNEVDSEKMHARLAEAGYDRCDDPAAADCIIVNTCSFIQQATEESIDAVLEAFALPRVERGDAAVVIAGCMPARYGSGLAAELPEAAGFVPCADEEAIADAVAVALSTCGATSRDAGRIAAVHAEPAQAAFGYVKISDGCSRHCSYCTIPSIRGSYHSFPFERIDADVRTKVDAGCAEVVLIAQDTGRWGADLEPRRTLAWLIERLATAYPDTLFRVMYVQPDGVTDELIDTIARHGNIASYLDMPIQHVDPVILRAMNRQGCRASFEDKVALIRQRIPDAVLRTTLIAGFPGETEEQFAELVDFAGSGCFDYVGVFPYSREEGTAAADLDAQIDEDEKMRRTIEVQTAADAAGAGLVAQRHGEVQRVIIEGVEEDGQRFGRTYQQAPDTDGVTYVDAGEIGDAVYVLIEDTLGYDMEGSVRAHG